MSGNCDHQLLRTIGGEKVLVLPLVCSPPHALQLYIQVVTAWVLEVYVLLALSSQWAHIALTWYNPIPFLCVLSLFFLSVSLLCNHFETGSPYFIGCTFYVECKLWMYLSMTDCVIKVWTATYGYMSWSKKANPLKSLIPELPYCKQQNAGWGPGSGANC